MDPILYWNEVALEANRVSHSNGREEQVGPPLSARALAIVHLAMYDAFAGASANPADLPAYLPGLVVAPPGISAAAAVAGAAHTTLRALFPSQRDYFDERLVAAGVPDPAVDKGLDYGREVGWAVLADRAEDPSASSVGYVASDARGRHRLDPDNVAQGFHAPFYGAKCRAFAVTARHGIDAPPALSSAAYRRALREVRTKGIAPDLTASVPASRRRTTRETMVGIYWGYDGAFGLGTPPRLYNQIVRVLAEAQGNSEAENARLFALVNVAMADAGTLAWEQKYIHDLWRPVVGLREYDTSSGPAATAGAGGLDPEGQVDWLPLGAPATNTTKKNFTPPFPAYPSGHATFGAAALHMARLFYGVVPGDRSADTLFDGLSFVSDEYNGMSTDNSGTVRPRLVRGFPGGLWQMIEENGRARVYLGVHWVFDAFAVNAGNQPRYNLNVGGVPLGLRIAEDIFNGARHAGMVRSTA